MRKGLLMLLTVGLLTLLGCAGTPGKAGKSVSVKESQLTGKYGNPMSADIYIEFKDDGTFCDKFGSRSACGKYVRDGNHVTLILESGTSFDFVVEGNALVTKEGGRYTKQ